MIKMVVMDVDGVLTDGSIIIGEGADESRIFNIKDGMGIALAREAGIRIVFLSARYSKALIRRAKDLGVDDIHQNASDKVSIVDDLMKKYMLKTQEVAYIGDDINDIPAMKRVGFPCAVGDAVDDVKKIAKHISQACGGKGAVREIIEMILRAEGSYDLAVETYLSQKDKKS